MSDQRQDRAFEVLANRGPWEQRQRLAYQMRHDGLRRINKPFPTAADFHFPMIDMGIDKLKPFWLAQAFSSERLCDFVSLKKEMGGLNEAAADYFNFHLRFETDYRYRMEQAVDTMLLRGRGVLKIVYDPFTQKLLFRSVDPLFVIMAMDYDDFDDADWFVEIQRLTVPQYQRNRNYDQSSLPHIKGQALQELAAVLLDKQIREGVTHSSREDIVVLWNHYERRPTGWEVRTHCPLAWDKHIRDPYHVPYEWDGQPLLPFYSITMEIKDEGWFAPRGLAELNAAFESYATKLWNEKADAMTFGNRPLFTTDKEMQNTANLRFMPGELIPGNIKAIQMPTSAYSFGEEINFTRQLSEQRSRMPDYGITREGEQDAGGKPRTATENNRIAALQDVGADHNGDIFRNIRLLKIYKHCWALICHREELNRQQGTKRKSMVYFAADELQTLPSEVLHDQYLVLPAGSSGTKQQRLARAVNRYQLFFGKPNIDQDELARDVIAADDPRLVRKLLVPSQVKQGEEAEDEAKEIGIMLLGFPAQVKPGEDHITRINVLVGFLHKQELTGAPVDPMALQRLQQHLAVHFQTLQQLDPRAAKELMGKVQMLEQQSAAPANVEQLPQPAIAQ